MATQPRTALRITVLWGLARTGLGTAAAIAPRAALRVWVGAGLPEPADAVLARALAGRDLALGLGTIASARSGRAVTPWVLASGAADLVDAAATFAARTGLPRRRRQLVLAASLSSVAVAAWLWGQREH